MVSAASGLVGLLQYHSSSLILRPVLRQEQPVTDDKTCLLYYGGHINDVLHGIVRRLIQFNRFVSLFVFLFLGPHLWPMEVPRIGVESQLQLPAYTTATAMRAPSNVHDLYTTAHGNAGSLTHWARPGIKPASSWILVRFVLLCHNENSQFEFLLRVYPIPMEKKSKIFRI